MTNKKKEPAIPTILDIAKSLLTISTREEVEAQLEVLRQFKIDFTEEDKATYFVVKRSLENKIKDIKDESGELEGIKIAHQVMIEDIRAQLNKAKEEGVLTRELVKSKSSFVYAEQRKMFFRNLPHGISEESNKMFKSFYDHISVLESMQA